MNGTGFPLTDVLSDAVGVLAPFGEILDQVSEHGRHAVDGLGVVVEEDLVFFFSFGTFTFGGRSRARAIDHLTVPYPALKSLTLGPTFSNIGPEKLFSAFS